MGSWPMKNQSVCALKYQAKALTELRQLICHLPSSLQREAAGYLFVSLPPKWGVNIVRVWGNLSQ